MPDPVSCTLTASALLLRFYTPRNAPHSLYRTLKEVVKQASQQVRRRACCVRVKGGFDERGFKRHGAEVAFLTRKRGGGRGGDDEVVGEGGELEEVGFCAGFRRDEEREARGDAPRKRLIAVTMLSSGSEACAIIIVHSCVWRDQRSAQERLQSHARPCRR